MLIYEQNKISSFHGGGFMAGRPNEYNPKLFMDHNVVVVSPQYRVGALGRKIQYFNKTAISTFHAILHCV